MKLTKQELELAKRMNDTGITWSIVAAYYKTNINTLREQIKDYETTIKRIHSANGTSRENK